MLKFFRDLFDTPDNNESSETHITGSDRAKNEKKIKLATCALFLEVAQSDEHFDKSERELIVSLMKKMFDLDEDEVNELIKQSDEYVRHSVSLYEFTDVVNRHFNKNEKFELIKNLWRLILADQKINKYEEHFIRTINNNFHLEHSDMIAAKLEIKDELGM